MNREPQPGADAQANDPTRVVWHDHTVSRDDRERLLGQRGAVVWLTGLSGCGKSTIANVLDQRLHQRGAKTFLLDGDNIRHGLCAPPERLAEQHGETFAERFGLSFAAADREENIRRIGSVTQLMSAAGLITLAAFVSPYRRDRDRVRAAVEQAGRPGDFIEVYVDTPLDVCESRDPKGLYRLARAGKIPNFTGISDPYEPPESPELHLLAAQKSPAELAAQIESHLEQHGFLTAARP